jgi:peptidyl-prolyl cis-trans isomerase C
MEAPGPAACGGSVLRPLIRFLLLGALVWVADRGLLHGGAHGALRSEIVVSAAELLRLRDAWVRVHGVPPSPPEERAEIDRAFEEEVLYREALARGLDRGDPSVRARLIAIMRFLGTGAVSDDESLYRQALALNLDSGEPAIRRHLALQMRLLASIPAEREPITDADLERCLRRNRELFRKPARVSFTQVFLATMRRGASAETDARRLLERLRADESPALDGVGDPFPLGSRFTRASAPTLESSFGAPFVAALADAPAGAWAGPIASAFGWHLVRVEERVPPATPPLEEARPRLVEMVRRERADARYADYVRTLKARYTLVLEDATATATAATVPAFRRLVPEGAEALE